MRHYEAISMVEEGSLTDETRGGHPEASQSVTSPPAQILTQTQSANAVPSPMINLVNDMKAKLFVGLGATQLVLGILEIVVNIGASVMRADIIWQIGPGYWCGLPVILAGLFGIAAGMTKKKHMAIAFLVAAIIAAVYTLGLLAVTGIGIFSAIVSISLFENGSVAWNAILLTVGTIELLISIISATICFSALCGRSQADGIQSANAVSSPMIHCGSNMKTKVFVGMGATQLVLGILEIMVNIGASVMRGDMIWYIGPGYWCGLPVILAGSFGMAAGMTKKKHMVIAFMSGSVMASVYTLSLLAVTGIGIVSAIVSDGSVAWNAILFTIGVIELLISIISATISFSALCGTSQSDGASPVNLAASSSQMTNWISDKKAKVFLIMGAAQLTLGILEIISNTVLVDVAVTWVPRRMVWYTAPGIWCGLFTIVTGFVGMAAGIRKEKSVAITFLVLSITTIVYTLGLLAATGLGLYHAIADKNAPSSNSSNFMVIWNAILLTAGIVELIVSAICATTCCSALRGTSKTTMMQSAPLNPALLSSQITSWVTNMKAKVFVAVGSIQLALGILEIVFNIGASAMKVEFISFLGPGYWCGLLAILAGSFGIAVGRTKRKSLVVTFLVLSSLASVYALGILATAGLGVVFEIVHPFRYRDPVTSYTWNSLLLITGFIQLIVSVVSTVICGSSLIDKPQSAVTSPKPDRLLNTNV